MNKELYRKIYSPSVSNIFDENGELNDSVNMTYYLPIEKLKDLVEEGDLECMTTALQPYLFSENEKVFYNIMMRKLEEELNKIREELGDE